MKFSLTSLIACIAAATSVSAAVAAPRATIVTVSYDTVYDKSTTSTLTVACSDGENGLYTAGYKTFGKVPGFPHIGGSFTIPGWNSENCGACYSLTYKNKTIYVTAVDHTDAGFNVAKKALDDLTGGLASQLGRINATYASAAASKCGF
jgi:hypothetical protein